MKKSVNFLLLGFFILSDLCFADNKKNLTEFLPNEWTLVCIIDSSGEQFKQTGKPDMFLISGEDYNNSFALYQGSLYAYGTWTIVDSILILTYSSKPVEYEIDSSVYKIIDNQPMLILYSDGEEVMRIANNQVVSGQNRYLNIIRCTEDSLILTDENIRFIYKSNQQKGARVAAGSEIHPMKSGMNTTSLFRGILGIFVLLFLAYLFSGNRKAIQWKSIGFCLLLEILLAVILLKLPFIQTILQYAGKLFIVVYNLTEAGSKILFKDIIDTRSYGGILLFRIFPVIVLISALSGLLFFYGIIQKLISACHKLFKSIFKLSGVESFSSLMNLFFGQVETPLFIKNYLEKTTRSELMLIMAGGMGTLSAAVFAVYAGILGGNSPDKQLFFITHILTASMLAFPGMIIVSKILEPQTEPVYSRTEIPSSQPGIHILDVLANGAWEGIKICLKIGALYLVVATLIALLNYLFFKIGLWTHLNESIAASSGGKYNELSFQYLLGYVFAPVSWITGVCGSDMVQVGQLFGEKVVLNELTAYTGLKNYIASSGFVQEKSMIIAIYMLSSFASISSVAIQYMNIGVLAPVKKTILMPLLFKALLAGIITTLLSAAIVGMIIA